MSGTEGPASGGGRLRRPSSLTLLAGVALAALGMFNLAWSVPTSSRAIMSMSYALRYNNLVAWAALLVACGVAYAAGHLRRRELAAAGEEAKSVPPPAGPVPRADVIALTAATALAFAGLAWATFGVPIFDNGFFFDRVAQALGGAVPWRDLYFPYGPLLLYVPTGLAWLSARLGAPAVLGYYVTFGATQVAGVPLLAWVLGRLPLARAHRRAFFWIFGASALMGVFSGLNYTLVRFLAPMAGVLLLAGWASRDRRPSPVALGIASLGLTVLNAGLSPEMGAAYAIASTGVLVFAADERGARRWTAAAVQAAGLAVLAVVAGRTVLEALAPIAGGAYRLPVLPSPYVLLFSGTALYAAFSLGTRTRPLSGPAPLGALLVAGLALAPSALGRADFGHVLWNGLAVFLVGAVVIGALRRRTYLLWAGAVVLVLPLWSAVNLYISVPTLFGASAASGQLPRGTVVSLGRIVVPGDAGVGDAYDEFRRTRPSGSTLDALLRLDRVAMPFGAADTLAFEYATRHKLVPVFADENGPVDDAQLAVVVDQLRGADSVVIPTEVAEAVSQRVLAGDVPLARMPPYTGTYASVTLQFPMDMRVRRKPYEGRYALGVAIGRDFEPVDIIGRYSVLRRRR